MCTNLQITKKSHTNMKATELSSSSTSNDSDISAATAPTAIIGEHEHSVVEWASLPNSLLIQRRTSAQWLEVDNLREGLSVTDGSRGNSVRTIAYYEIFSTIASIFMRAAAVFINIRLALDYYQAGQGASFLWTTICIVVPMSVTTLIFANMCHQDGKFSKGICKALQTLWFVFLSSFFFRYWNSLVYCIKCKRAELQGDREKQLKYYKLTIREESDVAFIRLFECFLESAPQKILQIAIVLAQTDNMSSLQTLAIISYFGSMAWCIAAYNRCSRYAQIDKNNINTQGLLLQLCWHFCISVSRTLCIAFVASIYPLWTIIACMVHAIVCGFITFIVDRPKFAPTLFLNFLFCMVLGIVYLFTYIPVRDVPTRRKYLLYYMICSWENVTCIMLFIFFTAKTFDLLIYALCAMAFSFYYIGLVFMIIYYLYFHPKITARNSKRINRN